MRCMMCMSVAVIGRANDGVAVVKAAAAARAAKAICLVLGVRGKEWRGRAQ